jgi:hypothetical protein
MASIKVKLSLNTTQTAIDLSDYGYDDKTWDDLTEDEQDVIKDSIREEHTIYLDIKSIEL